MNFDMGDKKVRCNRIIMSTWMEPLIFIGKILHTCKYKDAKFSGVAGKKVLVVGMGNSAVDAATNAATEGGYD